MVIGWVGFAPTGIRTPRGAPTEGEDPLKTLDE
jgi:hypothetical protein